MPKRNHEESEVELNLDDPKDPPSAGESSEPVQPAVVVVPPGQIQVHRKKATITSGGLRYKVNPLARPLITDSVARAERSSKAMPNPTTGAHASLGLEEEIQAVAGERSDLLARKHGGKELSLGEQGRLESLTARLRELLPPVSVSELEVLLAMAEEAEAIRKRARVRRQRLGIA